MTLIHKKNRAKNLELFLCKLYRVKRNETEKLEANGCETKKV
jgi:hypothetical protein